MNHQPFEGWLLHEEQIEPAQKVELEAHLRICRYCSALVETEKALQGAKKISPAAGFGSRFRTRLALQQAAELRRRRWGAVLFTAGGLVMLVWLLGPYLASFLAAPASWITALVEWGVFLLTTLQAVRQAGSVLLQVLPGFLAPFLWMVLFSASAGIGLLWSVSIWRFVRVPRGV